MLGNLVEFVCRKIRFGAQQSDSRDLSRESPVVCQIRTVHRHNLISFRGATGQAPYSKRAKITASKVSQNCTGKSPSVGCCRQNLVLLTGGSEFNPKSQENKTNHKHQKLLVKNLPT